MYFPFPSFQDDIEQIYQLKSQVTNLHDQLKSAESAADEWKTKAENAQNQVHLDRNNRAITSKCARLYYF